MQDPRCRIHEDELAASLELSSRIDSDFAPMQESFDLGVRLAKALQDYKGDDPNLVREVFESYWNNVDVTKECEIREHIEFESFLPYTEIYAQKYGVEKYPTTLEGAAKKAEENLRQSLAESYEANDER